MVGVRGKRIVGVALVATVVPAVAGVAIVAGESSPRAPVAASAPANPCLGPEAATLRCPDLMMSRPFGIRVDRKARPGRTLLRAGNSIDSVGAGPAELRGRRTSGGWMQARQYIDRVGGGHLKLDSGGRLQFKKAHLDRRWWKFHDAARFELWTLDAAGERQQRVRVGPKVAYCLRDLERTEGRLPRSPRRAVYPACSTDRDRRRATLGTSPGWSDVYPPAYPEQWIDVSGLRGCFAYVHIADPGNAILESNEDNNQAQVILRLPFRRSDPRGDCPGRDFGRRYRAADRASSRAY
ncbi:lysyl oxidase family protein [Patulibacter defluvii]|uniref:lysyl oxidase family protein n=1 Tax=Patulibacter defluvii TaxID=3095358 RepID=UPI002A75AA87|nr:lysyl oxidase family protein [Patulibacter sp. DM4]